MRFFNLAHLFNQFIQSLRYYLPKIDWMFFPPHFPIRSLSGIIIQMIDNNFVIFFGSFGFIVFHNNRSNKKFLFDWTHGNANKYDFIYIGQALLRGALCQQSAVILICMAVDRYMCALHPEKYQLHSSKKVSFRCRIILYSNHTPTTFPYTNLS